MSQQQGAALQSYNNDLVKCIEEMCTKRDQIHRQILLEEEEKTMVQTEVRQLAERLARVVESLSRKYAIQNDYDKTIGETEQAYMKIIESSQVLAQALSKEVDGGGGKGGGGSPAPNADL